MKNQIKHAKNSSENGALIVFYIITSLSYYIIYIYIIFIAFHSYLETHVLQLVNNCNEI